MSELPLRTRVYTLLLVIVTSVAFAVTWSQSQQSFDTNHLLTAGILLVMILAAELLDVSFPHSVITFHVSVSAAFCFAAGLTAGPLLGGLVVALAHFADGVYVRRELIKTIVNAAGLGLSTLVSGTVYLQIADLERSTVGSVQNIIAAVVAATVYTLVNTGTLALIVAPVMGLSTFQMWRENFSGLYVELLTLATLGSIIPVLVRENPLAIVLLIVPLMIGPHLAFKGIRQAHHETRVAMEGLAEALERRDPYTFRHSIRVTDYTGTILAQMPHIPRPTADAIIAAAGIHDLGKVGSRDGSLKKPGALTPEERYELEQHAAIGADIVDRLEAYKPSVAIIRHHHERWDGSGYPDKLAGEQIPLGSRIIGVADAYDAMTSDRVYRPAMSTEEALAELQKGAGTQFDPHIVELFHRALTAPMPAPNAPQSAERANEAQESGLRILGAIVERAEALARRRPPRRVPALRQKRQDERQRHAGRGQGDERSANSEQLLQRRPRQGADQTTSAEREEKDGKEPAVDHVRNGMLKIGQPDDLVEVSREPSDHEGHDREQGRTDNTKNGEGHGAGGHGHGSGKEGRRKARARPGDDAAHDRPHGDRRVEDAHPAVPQPERVRAHHKEGDGRLHKERQTEADQRVEAEILSA